MASPPDANQNPAQQLDDIEVVFKALAHAARRHVLLVLHFRGGEMSSRDIAARFRCSWPTTTRHLSVLREAGLVTVVQRGRERYYRLQHRRLQGVVRDWLGWFDETPRVTQSPTAEPDAGHRP